MKGCAWLALTLLAMLSMQAGERWRPGDSISFRQPATIKLGRVAFDLNADKDVRRLAQLEIEVPSDHKGSGAQKRDLRGVRLLNELAASFSESNGEPRQQMIEIARAIANNHRPAIPNYVDLIELPILIPDALDNPIGEGKKPASNLAAGIDSDPRASSFWRRPQDISGQDLGAGFGRTTAPNFTNVVWTYAGPKKAGRNAGCEVKADGRHIKVKFAEVHSEPFTARLFHALGYHVAPTDFCPQLRIKYDRRFFTEFNLRSEMKMKVGMFFIPFYSFNLQEEFDPFDFIDHAVLKNGAKVDRRELRAALLKKTGEFDVSVENHIDWLATVGANVQMEPKDSEGIGPWEFEGLGHEDLRELRGAGVLAAWLGWWDSRFENTRLRVARCDEGIELRHYFNDLGGGLGLSGGTFRHSCEKVEEFTDSFTRRRGGKFEIVHYEPVEDAGAFRNITPEDARWMAGLIRQITDAQLVEALKAAGFSAREVELYAKKLRHRRSKLLHDLQMAF